MYSIAISLVIVLLVAQPAMPQFLQPAQQILNELPPCSILRAEFNRGVRGNGVDQPYMAKMRQAGVERALLEVHVALGRNDRRQMEIVRRLYFGQLDGPHSQKSDAATLEKIEASGLARELEGIARRRVLAAPLVRGHSKDGADNRFSSFVEFFSNPWLQEQKVALFRSGQPAPLTVPVVHEDALATEALLKSHTFREDELDKALLDAALSRYDNSAVIKLLLGAGADVNARTSAGTTPLMNAVPHSCNLQPLLDGGADLNVIDKWGRTALQLARESKQTYAIGLLERAGAAGQPEQGEQKDGNRQVRLPIR
jgi:hypothetical protein